MKIILATDAFPPHAGGSGWSTYELARGLRGRGHDIHVLKVTAGRPHEQHTSYDGLPVMEFGVYAPNVPGIRNYFKNERLYPKVAARLTALIHDTQADIVHGQHVLSAPPAVQAAKTAGIPSVVTVRDYWPVCYRSDLLHTPATLPLCPGCSAAAATQHGRPRIGLTGLGLTLVRRYLRSNMALKLDALAAADAVIAVSAVIGRDLRERAPGQLTHTRLEIIPNPVSIEALRQRVAPRPMADPYALYVGKLAVNKGTDHLVEVMRCSGLDWPLMILGDGPDRDAIEAQARRTGATVQFLGWRDQVEVATWMAHAGVLIFPSRGPESLSRVLIEASALGVPIAAMNTGGTADIVEDEVTGLLSADAAGLAEDVRRIRLEEPLRKRLGAAAAQRAAERFDATSVVARVESLYRELIEARRR